LPFRLKLTAVQMEAQTQEKIQPWKAQWLARELKRGKEGGAQVERAGTSHGFTKGQEVILDGTTSGNAFRADGKANMLGFQVTAVAGDRK